MSTPEMTAWMNGRLLPSAAEPALAVTDHGVTVGDGVFETLKITGGEVFATSRHLHRLQRSADGLGLPPVDQAWLRDGIAEVLAARPIDFGRLRITYTGGPAPMGSGRGDGPATVTIVSSPADPMPPTTTAVTVEWPRNERGATAGLKTTSYAENVIALARAAESGATEAIFGNTVGTICEGTGSNVFYVVDGELRTPTLASGCLAGVTRALVLEWYGAREVDEPMQVLDRAEEIFLVSTTRDVQGLTRLDDRELAAPGPITEAAAARWREKERESLDP